MDKCGIYICLESLRKYENVKVFLSVKEEVGCVGSMAADLSFFSDCAFMLQADRKGDDEVIKNTNGVEVASQEFMDLCKPTMDLYGYKFSTGTSTDIGALIKREAGCSGFNFGAGYFKPHSLEDKICISSLENCMNLMFYITDRALEQNKKFDHIPPKPVYTQKTYPSRVNLGGSYGYSNYQRGFNQWNDDYYSDYYGSYSEVNKPKKDSLKIKEKDNIYCEYCSETSCVDCPFKKENYKKTDEVKTS